MKNLLICLFALVTSVAQATVNTTINTITYTGNSATTNFSFSFAYPGAASNAASDFSVTTVVGGVTTVLPTNSYIITFNSPVSPNPTGVGGSVLYPLTGSPLASGATITITRILPAIQGTSLGNQGILYPPVLEQEYDYLTMLIQQGLNSFTHAITAPFTDPAGLNYILPTAASRGGLILCFDAMGNVTACSVAPSGIISSAMAPVVGAGTLAAGRSAFGLGSAATQSYNCGLGANSSAANLDVSFGTTQVSTNQSISAASCDIVFVATGPITFTLPRANTLWNGFGFWVDVASGGSVTLTVNSNDIIQGLSVGNSASLAIGVWAYITTDAASSGNWRISTTQTYPGGSGQSGAVPIQALSGANVSGSANTTTGTISGGSATLLLASASDFISGQGIRVNHAGAGFVPSAPSGLSVTPTGTTGATTYQYQIASIDASGGVGAAITAVSTSTGNATLTAANYNALSWSPGASASGYAIYGNKSGSMTLLAITAVTTFNDTGLGAQAGPDWLPSTPQVSSLADYLVTTISAGGGTTTLTLAATAVIGATSQTVLHDDTVALQAIINTAASAGVPFYLNNGTYNISSALVVTSRSFQMYGSGFGGGTIILSSPTQDGIDLNGSGYYWIHDFHILGNIGGTFLANISGALLSDAGGTGKAPIYQRLFMQNGYNCIVTIEAIPTISESELACSNYVIQLTSPGDGTVKSNNITPESVPGATDLGNIGIRVIGDPAGLRISNNKINGPISYALGIGVIIQQTDGDFFVEGNSIESCATGFQADRTGSFLFGTIVIVGNEFSCSSRGVYFPNTTASWMSGVTITGNYIVATTTAVNLVAVDKFVISSNILSGATGILIGAAATNCGIGFNTFNTTTQITDSSGACIYSAVTGVKPTYP